MSDENRKKTMFGFKKAIGFLFALFIVGAVALYLNLGSIVKNFAETVGSETLGVKVTIGSLDLDPRNKTVTIRNIRVANPQGFSKPYAMKIGLVNIAMDSFSKDLLVFNDVTLKDSELFLEVSDKGTNLSALKENIGKNKPAPTQTAKDKTAKDETTPPKIILSNFLLNNAQLHPSVTMAGKDLKTITLPDVKLTGIGQNTNGAPASDVIAQIFGEVTSTALMASAQAGMLEGMSEAVLKDMKLPADTLEDRTRGLGGFFGN